jgi:hypothetical protein
MSRSVMYGRAARSSSAYVSIQARPATALQRQTDLEANRGISRPESGRFPRIVCCSASVLRSVRARRFALYAMDLAPVGEMAAIRACIPHAGLLHCCSCLSGTSWARNFNHKLDHLLRTCQRLLNARGRRTPKQNRLGAGVNEGSMHSAAAFTSGGRMPVPLEMPNIASLHSHLLSLKPISTFQ